MAMVEPNLKDKRVLVVEDEPVLADLIQEVLKGEGCRVTLAEDGVQATHRLEGDAYDLILTDVRMPGLGGIGLYHHVRDRKPEMARRMIFITGDTVNPQTMSFLREEGHRFIEKPFHIAKFLKVLREALSP